MLTHGNVVADFSGFLKVTEVNKVDSNAGLLSRSPSSLRGFFCALFFFPLI